MFIAHLPGPHLTRSSRALSATFRTTVFSQSPLRWFRAFVRTTALEGQQPPSPMQHRSPRDRQLPSLPRFPRSCSQGFRRLSGRCGSCTFWRLGLRQSSFRHITRIPRRAAPYAWTRPPVSWHAIFPFSPFGSWVSHQIQRPLLPSLPATRAIQQCTSWRTDYYGSSVAIELASRRRSHVHSCCTFERDLGSHSSP